MNEAIDNCKKIASEVQGYYIDLYPDSLDEAKDVFEELEGISPAKGGLAA